MNWIRRNIFLLVGILAAVGVMTGAIFYLVSRYSLNVQYNNEFNDIVAKIQEYLNKPVFPSEENVAAIKESTKVFTRFMSDVETLVSPVAYEKMDNQKFHIHLDNTISELTKEATNYSVALPAKFKFTFADIQPKINLTPYGIEPLSLQLAETRLICMTLFQSRVHALDVLQRVRVSPDDGAAGADYIQDGRIVTNGFSIVTPYKVSFRCFTPELSTVLNTFASCKEYIVVRTLAVEAEGSAAAAATTGAGEMQAAPNTPPNMQEKPATPGMATTPTGPAGAKKAPARPVLLPTVLDGRTIKVAMEIDVVRPNKGGAARPAAPAPGAAVPKQ